MTSKNIAVVDVSKQRAVLYFKNRQQDENHGPMYVFTVVLVTSQNKSDFLHGFPS